MHSKRHIAAAAFALIGFIFSLGALLVDELYFNEGSSAPAEIDPGVYLWIMSLLIVLIGSLGTVFRSRQLK